MTPLVFVVIMHFMLPWENKSLIYSKKDYLLIPETLKMEYMFLTSELSNWTIVAYVDQNGSFMNSNEKYKSVGIIIIWRDLFNLVSSPFNN